MTTDAGRFAGDIPGYYDRHMGPVLFADYAAEMARRVAMLAPRRVLETAAGTGIVTRCLRDTLPGDAELVATDFNPPMLEIAKAKFRADEAVAFQPADGTALPFPDARFDAIVCQFGIMFFPDKAKGYREAFRVLAPGGHYFFSVWDSHAHNPSAGIAHAALAAAHPADPPRFWLLPHSLSAIDPIKEGLSEAGFGEVTISVVPLLKKIADLEAFVRGLVYGNPSFTQISERGIDPERLVAAMHAGLRQAVGESGTLKLQAILYCARKPDR